MIKLKKLLKESIWGERKFGEPLPTMKDYKEAYNKNISKGEKFFHIPVEKANLIDIP